MEDIYKKLRFDEETCSVFKFLKKYHELLDTWLEKNELTEEILKRYILVSFWAEYRAANHQGSDLTIDKISFDEHIKKKQEVNNLWAQINEKYPGKLGNFHKLPESALDKNFNERKLRRDIYFQYFTQPVKSTPEYLSLIGYPFSEKDIAEYFFKFVTTGAKAPAPNRE